MEKEKKNVAAAAEAAAYKVTGKSATLIKCLQDLNATCSEAYGILLELTPKDKPATEARLKAFVDAENALLYEVSKALGVVIEGDIANTTGGVVDLTAPILQAASALGLKVEGGAGSKRAPAKA